MRAIFNSKPNIPTLIDRIINVAHRLALKLDSTHSDEYIIYMQNGFCQNYNAFARLSSDERSENLVDFHATAIEHVVAILLRLERPISHTVIQFAPATATAAATATYSHQNAPKFFAEMLAHYLRVGRYPHESITERVYYDSPLFREDADEAHYKRIRHIIDVLVVMLATYLSPMEATYQYRYLVSGIRKATEYTPAQFDAIVQHMQHKNLTRISWELRFHQPRQEPCRNQPGEIFVI